MTATIDTALHDLVTVIDDGDAFTVPSSVVAGAVRAYRRRHPLLRRGRPRTTVTASDAIAARAGSTMGAAARHLGISVSTLRRVLREDQ